jgi:hypothetical protein
MSTPPSVIRKAERQKANDTAALRAMYAKEHNPQLPGWSNADDVMYHSKTGGAGWPFPTGIKPDPPVSRGEVNAAVSRLVSRGLAKRVPGRNQALFRLTEAGTALAREIVAAEMRRG